MNKPTINYINSILCKNDPANLRSEDKTEYITEARQIYESWGEKPIKELISSILEDNFCYCLTVAQCEMIEKGLKVSKNDMYYQKLEFSNLDLIEKELKNVS